VTARELSAIGIKLMGTFFAVSSLVKLLSLVASLVVFRQVDDLPNAANLFRLNALVIFAELAVAGALVFKADALADRMFSSQRLEITGLSRRDLLIGGIALYGVSVVAGAVPGILRFAGQAIWFAQGTKQAEFFPAMERSWQSLASDVLALFVGGTLLAKAVTFGSALDGRLRRHEAR